ncbi:hypothetical protein CUJ83_08935 [Methanocella sp. CWC-04]|uniref:Uncharacterized protein n=1 Tax=Methanooceanicella nereidis TaxID=2052831 RepID=A0AAP2W7J1_9EURY|nr:hypothetical protein [Methanocella sp. CWC-04]MCD1295121.1 hypothetical protein [Methanocella sp. CWC-04]
MSRVYYHFPREIDFERHYGFNADMRYLMKVMASIHGGSGSMEFETVAPNVNVHVRTVKARRDVVVEVTEKKIDFIPLTQENLTRVLPTLEQDGTVDYRVTVRYSYYDENFQKMTLKSDVFLVRTILGDDLTIQVKLVDGHGRTLPEEIANTIETQLQSYHG